MGDGPETAVGDLIEEVDNPETEARDLEIEAGGPELTAAQDDLVRIADNLETVAGAPETEDRRLRRFTEDAGACSVLKLLVLVLIETEDVSSPVMSFRESK